MSKSHHSNTPDGRSHRLVALIGFIGTDGQKHLLTLNGHSTLFPGTVFHAKNTSEAAFVQARDAALVALLTEFSLDSKQVSNKTFVQADQPRAAGGNKLYLMGTLKVLPTQLKLDVMPLEQVLEHLATQEGEGRCSQQFIDRVFEAGEAIAA